MKDNYMTNKVKLEEKLDELQLENHEMQALAVNAMGNSIKMLTKRSYLSHLEQLELDVDIPNNGSIHWVRICQVGKSLTTSVRQYFSTIQKILYSCHEPGRKQVVFLIKGDGKQVSLYIGLKCFGTNNGEKVAEYLATNITNIWAGTQTKFIEDNSGEGPDQCFSDRSFRSLYAITGIPSFTKNEGEESLTAIDTLIGALSHHKFAYVVFADPIHEDDITGIITQCNEMAGQLESAKSYNFQEGKNINVTNTEGESHTKGESESKRDEKSQRNYAIGLGLATTLGFFPGLTEAIPVLSTLVSTLVENKNFGLGLMTICGILGGGIAQKTNSSSDTHTTQSSLSVGRSSSITKTFVNRHVSYALGLLDSQLSRFEQGQGVGMWRTSAYLLTSNDVVGRNAISQLKSIISGYNSHLEPIRAHRIDGISGKINSDNYGMPDIRIKVKPSEHPDSIEESCSLMNPFEGQVSTLSTLLTTEELSMLINFPQKSVPGLSVIEGTDALKLTPPIISDGVPMIPLGKLLYSNAETELELAVPLATLAKHTLVAGVNGSGKTNTILGILSGLAKKQFPFLVLEPAKTEYVEWALQYNEQLEKDQSEGRRQDETAIRIMMPGKNRYVMNGKEYAIKDKLTFNPFEVISLRDEEPDESEIMAHIDRVKSVFAAAFPMQEILPVVMERLIYHIYTERKWLSKTEQTSVNIEGGRKFPNLNYLKSFIRAVIADLEYEERITRNITAALTTRIDSLLQGWKREMLNVVSSPNNFWRDLFSGKCVINLSGMGDDTDRSFIMSMLLMFLYEYRIAESEANLAGFSFNSNTLRHLMVVEEAHRVMERCLDMTASQYKSGMLFSNMLSEIRAYGQGLMIVDQVPSRLIPDAIKNTNVKIIHKLVSMDDIESMAGSLGLDLQQQKIIPRLSTGQAIVSGVGSSEVGNVADFDVYWCKIQKNK